MEDTVEWKRNKDSILEEKEKEELGTVDGIAEGKGGYGTIW